MAFVASLADFRNDACAAGYGIRPRDRGSADFCKIGRRDGIADRRLVGKVLAGFLFRTGNGSCGDAAVYLGGTAEDREGDREFGSAYD